MFAELSNVCLCLLQDNTHRLTLTMSPDERFLEKQTEAEEQKLKQKIQNLSEADHKDIYEKCVIMRPQEGQELSVLFSCVDGLMLLFLQVCSC